MRDALLYGSALAVGAVVIGVVTAVTIPDRTRSLAMSVSMTLVWAFIVMLAWESR